MAVSLKEKVFQRGCRSKRRKIEVTTPVLTESKMRESRKEELLKKTPVRLIVNPETKARQLGQFGKRREVRN